MTDCWLSDPAGPLIAFGGALGISAAMWSSREELERLTYNDPNFSRNLAVSLTLEQLNSLTDSYGDALTCRFLLGDLVVLDVAPDMSEEDLERFRADTRQSPTVSLDFRLDKAQLIENRLCPLAGCWIFLYLFPQALEEYLTSPLGVLESQLWGEESARKVILLVPGREIWLTGPYLAVLGGTRIENWREVVPEEPPDAERVQALYQICRDNLKWQGSWLQYLTPLHLMVDGHASPGDAIMNALCIHFVNLIALYTADRTVLRSNGQWVATYAGATQSVEIVLGDSRESLGAVAHKGIACLAQLVEWAYDPRWSADRLPLVQIAVVQALHTADPAVRYRLLLHNAAHIFEGLQWHWKAFIEGKVDAYTAQVQTLEDYVAETAQAVADQVSAMIKSLSDTMLAAMGAFLGSFIAALFKDKFTPIVFVFGMVVSAAYVLAFPLCYNMLNQQEHYCNLVEQFETRRRRFEERIYPERVDDIVGAQIYESQRRFECWFKVITITYVVVAALFLIAAFVIPHMVGAPASTTIPTPTPTPTVGP